MAWMLRRTMLGILLLGFLGIFCTASSAQTATSTTLNSSADPSVVGQSVTFTATITPQSGGTPTGTVNFMQGAKVLSTGTVANGQATYTTTFVTGGARPLAAKYSGDSNFSGSTSAILTQTVSRIPTTNVMTSSQNPSTQGQAVTLFATVNFTSSGSGVALPTGKMSFDEGPVNLGVGAVTNGIASFTLSTLPAGTHVLKAIYAGDINYTASTSPNFSQVVSITISKPVSFIDSRNYATADSPIAFALGDFNSDGTLDFAVANNGSKSISSLAG